MVLFIKIEMKGGQLIIFLAVFVLDLSQIYSDSNGSHGGSKSRFTIL